MLSQVAASWSPSHLFASPSADSKIRSESNEPEQQIQTPSRSLPSHSSPPRSILKRRHSVEEEDTNGTTTASAFTSPPVARASSNTPTSSGRRSIRLRIPRTKRQQENEASGADGTQHEIEDGERMEDEAELPLSPDFDEVELEPMSEVASSSSKEYFGVKPEKAQLEVSQKQLAARKSRKEAELLHQKRASHYLVSRNRLVPPHPSNSAHLPRSGLSRYGMAPQSIIVRASQTGVRRSTTGGFRVSTRPSLTYPCPPPPPARALSRKENALLQKLYEANQERSRMEQDEMQHAREEAEARAEAERLAAESVLLAEKPESPSHRVRNVHATNSSPPPPSARPETPSPTEKQQVQQQEAQEEEEDVFSPRSASSSEEEQEEAMEDLEMADDEVEPEHMQIEIPLAHNEVEEDEEQEPQTPRKDIAHVIPLSQSPLLHAPKKRRTMENSPIAAGGVAFTASPARATQDTVMSSVDSPSRFFAHSAKPTVRRSLLPEMVEVEVEDGNTADNGAVSLLPTQAGVDQEAPTTVDALLKSIQQDAKEAREKGKICVQPQAQPEVAAEITSSQSAMEDLAGDASSTSAPTAATPSPPPRPPSSYVFVMTVKSHPSLVKIIESLGGRVHHGEDLAGVTHVIASGLKEDTWLERTAKVLTSMIGHARFLLHPDYVRACEKAGRFLPETEFEWCNRQEHNLTQALKKYYHTNTQPFDGWRVVVALQKRNEIQSKLVRELIELGGGTVVNESDHRALKSATHFFFQTKVRKEKFLPKDDPEAASLVSSLLSRHDTPESVMLADLTYPIEWLSCDDAATRRRVIERKVEEEEEEAAVGSLAAKSNPTVALPSTPTRTPQPRLASRSPANSPSKSAALSRVPSALATSTVASLNSHDNAHSPSKRATTVEASPTGIAPNNHAVHVPTRPSSTPSVETIAGPMDFSVETPASSVTVATVKPSKKLPRELLGLTDALSVHELSVSQRRHASLVAETARKRHVKTSSEELSIAESNATSVASSIRKSQKRRRSPSPVRAESRSLPVTSSNSEDVGVSSLASSNPRSRVPRELAGLVDSLSHRDMPSSELEARAESRSKRAKLEQTTVANSSSDVQPVEAQSSQLQGRLKRVSSYPRVRAPNGEMFQIMTEEQNREWSLNMFEVSEVIDRRVVNDRPEWRVKWRYWPHQFDSWEHRKYFIATEQDPDQMLARYRARQTAK